MCADGSGTAGGLTWGLDWRRGRSVGLGRTDGRTGGLWWPEIGCRRRARRGQDSDTELTGRLCPRCTDTVRSGSGDLFRRWRRAGDRTANTNRRTPLQKYDTWRASRRPLGAGRRRPGDPPAAPGDSPPPPLLRAPRRRSRVCRLGWTTAAGQAASYRLRKRGLAYKVPDAPGLTSEKLPPTATFWT